MEIFMLGIPPEQLYGLSDLEVDRSLIEQKKRIALCVGANLKANGIPSISEASLPQFQQALEKTLTSLEWDHTWRY